MLTYNEWHIGLFPPANRLVACARLLPMRHVSAVADQAWREREEKLESAEQMIWFQDYTTE
jgi:hypothetical protein